MGSMNLLFPGNPVEFPISPQEAHMLDPESRELKLPQIADEKINLFMKGTKTHHRACKTSYEINRCKIKRESSACDVATKLKSTGIEPFMIRRAGVLVEMGE